MARTLQDDVTLMVSLVLPRSVFNPRLLFGQFDELLKSKTHRRRLKSGHSRLNRTTDSAVTARVGASSKTVCLALVLAGACSERTVSFTQKSGEETLQFTDDGVKTRHDI